MASNNGKVIVNVVDNKNVVLKVHSMEIRTCFNPRVGEIEYVLVLFEFPLTTDKAKCVSHSRLIFY
jgi:hypothetical protein